MNCNESLADLNHDVAVRLVPCYWWWALVCLAIFQGFGFSHRCWDWQSSHEDTWHFAKLWTVFVLLACQSNYPIPTQGNGHWHFVHRSRRGSEMLHLQLALRVEPGGLGRWFQNLDSLTLQVFNMFESLGLKGSKMEKQMFELQYCLILFVCFHVWAKEWRRLNCATWMVLFKPSAFVFSAMFVTCISAIHHLYHRWVCCCAHTLQVFTCFHWQGMSRPWRKSSPILKIVG